MAAGAGSGAFGLAGLFAGGPLGASGVACGGRRGGLVDDVASPRGLRRLAVLDSTTAHHAGTAAAVAATAMPSSATASTTARPAVPVARKAAPAAGPLAVIGPARLWTHSAWQGVQGAAALWLLGWLRRPR